MPRSCAMRLMSQLAVVVRSSPLLLLYIPLSGWVFSFSLLTIFLILRHCEQGLVDLDNEIAKCNKKLDLVRLNLQKIIKVESQPEYEETVPLNVRDANLEKVNL